MQALRLSRSRPFLFRFDPIDKAVFIDGIRVLQGWMGMSYSREAVRVVHLRIQSNKQVCLLLSCLQVSIPEQLAFAHLLTRIPIRKFPEPFGIIHRKQLPPPVPYPIKSTFQVELYFEFPQELFNLKEGTMRITICGIVLRSIPIQGPWVQKGDEFSSQQQHELQMLEYDTATITPTRFSYKALLIACPRRVRKIRVALATQWPELQ